MDIWQYLPINNPFFRYGLATILETDRENIPT